MTLSPPMNIADIADLAISKADTIIATGAAIGTGAWAWRTKSANARLADAQTDKTAVDMMVTVAHELRTDLTAIKGDLAACHAEKDAMRSDLNTQERKIHDLTELFARSMEAQGLPMPIKRPHDLNKT